MCSSATRRLLREQHEPKIPEAPLDRGASEVEAVPAEREV